MIIKFFELNKLEKNKYNFFLLYGNNKGLIDETLKKITSSKNKSINKYDENEIIKNSDNFLENITNRSFFENERIIIISHATDKIIKIIEDIIERNLEDIILILKSDALEKKSKLRNLFEKNKQLICVPFYEDNQQTLNMLASNFFKEKKISLSQQNINLITERCSGDRINLYNELKKIENFSKNKKNIKTDDILKLTNLAENFDFAELVDNSLAKNQKKTLHILNENNFVSEDSVKILRIFMQKFKRLLKLQAEIKNKKNVNEVISNFKPPIFWKEKDIVKRQIQVWDYDRIQNSIQKVNSAELLVKKNPSVSTNIVTNFILEQTNS